MTLIKELLISYTLLFFCIFYGFAQNNPPIPAFDVATADQDTTLNVPSGAPDNYTNLLDNDTDIDGDTLSITRFSINDGISWTSAGGTINIAGIGSITIHIDGTYTFVPVAGYNGFVPNIIYEVTDGIDTSIATLYLTVETAGDLLEITGMYSCNQGYTANGDYKIRYSINLHNKSITRGYHQNSEITNIQLFDDLNAVFGDCITLIEREYIAVNAPEDFVGSTYPQEWTTVDYDEIEFSESDTTPGAQGILENPTAKIYPKQSLSVNFCITVDPFCNGRPNPTPSGSGIDFTNIINVTSNKGNDTRQHTITDFHTSETTVAANFFIPNLINNVYDPIIEPNQTFDYNHRIIITNDGNAQANNVNFNLGLGEFLDRGATFSTLAITQISGPTVNINPSYNGDTDALLLTNGNNLAAGETVILEINYIVNPLPAVTNVMYFRQLNTSMTQGNLDNQGSPPSSVDEFSNSNKRLFSYVFWDDAQGNHLDRYYKASSDTEIPSSNNQCQCETLGMRLPYTITADLQKTSLVSNENVNGITEYQEVTFEFTLTNTSAALQLENIQITDDLNLICGGNVISVSNPTITNSTATINPTINPAFNGTSNQNIFDGNSGIIKAVDTNSGTAAEFITVQFKVVFKDNCFGNNIANGSASDHAGLNTIPFISTQAPVNAFSDTDNDGINDVIDLDDDNDSIPDTVEYNGLNPLDDNDNDGLPNYRDTDYGVDSNNDGIVDLFDFDLDGVPNHFDFDSDNDGMYDIVESGNGVLDTSGNGQTDSIVGANGLDNTVENIDDGTAVINYTLPNIDTDTNFNYLDIDSDNDGIVDNIEAQTTDTYTPPNTADNNGVVYTNGLTPIDTDGDNTPDYLDIDTDNDARDDSIEGWDFNNDGIPETIFTNIDSDNDGLVNSYDNDNTQINPTNGQIPTDFPNADNPLTTELDWREKPAIIVVINNVTVTEGNDMVFTISLVSLGNQAQLKPINEDVIINIFTSDGTGTTTAYEVATAPFDYTEIPNIPTTITIPAGNTSYTVTIPTIDDIIDELDELMTLNALVTTANTTNPSTNNLEANIEVKGIGTIQDNDDAPDIIMNDTREEEGIDLIHTLTLSHPTSTPVIVEIKTTDITATNPFDYTSFNETVTIDGTVDPTNPNLTKDFHIITIEDNINEPDEENLHVDGTVTSANIANIDLNKYGVIIDKEPEPSMTISSPTIVEGGNLVFEISLSNENYNDVNLNIFTNNGTAQAPLDYTSLSSQVTIPAETLSILVEIQTIDDLLVEDIEELTLKGIVTSFNTDNIEAEGTGTIIDNETPNLFSPNDDGLSDVFEVISLKQYPNFKMQIFDRWGSQVYDYSNNGNPNPLWWNGTIKGNPVPEGVYYYTIDYNNGVTAPKAGFIQLIR